MSADLLQFVNDLSSRRILVVGDLILDHYVRGDVSRISPEAPIPVLAVKDEESILGGAANVASNIVSMGAKCHLIGVIGNDQSGKTFRKLAKSIRGLSLGTVIEEGRPTSTKSRVVARHQQMLRVDSEEVGPYQKATQSDLMASFRAALKETDLVILSDYGKGVLEDAECKRMIAAARKAKVPVVVDPKGRDYGKYKGATAITPNRLEAETATGLSCAADKATQRAAKELQESLDLDVAFITLGPGGVALLTREGKYSRIPTEARSVFDVTGAGDTFIATLGTFLAQGAPPEVCAALANTASGIKVAKFGAAAITRDEVRRAIVAKHHNFDYHSKILESNDLKEICRALREAGRRIVFTNGCFDILHAGHVTYLNFCRSHGDVLVLGLNSDASVRRQGKGDDRPINHQDDRARVLAALADIDFIAFFEEDTPTKLIKAAKPHVLVKGADWKGKTVAGADIVEKLGGEVVFAPILKGRSTTNIVEKMRKS